MQIVLAHRHLLLLFLFVFDFFNELIDRLDHARLPACVLWAGAAEVEPTPDIITSAGKYDRAILRRVRLDHRALFSPR